MLWLFLRGRYPDWQIVLAAVAASTITLPFVWFFFPTLPMQWAGYIALAEVFVVVVEAGFYRIMLKTSWKDAVVVSVLCNWTSFVIGLGLS